MFFRKPDESNAENPPALNVPGCGETWTINQFYTVYEKLFPDDFDKECEL